MCKRIPPEGCRLAGTEGLEPPRPVLETGALPAELDPHVVVPKRNRPPGLPGGGVGLWPAVGYMSGTVLPVASSICWHGEA
jgi:hypothetical protein